MHEILAIIMRIHTSRCRAFFSRGIYRHMNMYIASTSHKLLWYISKDWHSAELCSCCRCTRIVVVLLQLLLMSLLLLLLPLFCYVVHIVYTLYTKIMHMQRASPFLELIEMGRITWRSECWCIPLIPLTAYSVYSIYQCFNVIYVHKDPLSLIIRAFSFSNV